MHGYNEKIYKNPAQVYLSSLNSKNSIRNCSVIINNLCIKLSNTDYLHFNWSDINYTHFLTLKQSLLDTGILPESVNHYLSVFKSVARECWRLGVISVETYMRIKDVKRIKGESDKKGRCLDLSEIQAAINFGFESGKIQGIRDSAIISLAYGGGLRRSELTTINTCDYDGQSLLVIGKGNIQKRVSLPEQTNKHLHLWLNARNNNHTALFNHIRNKGYIFNKRLAPRTIGDIIEKRYKQAGLKPFTPHDLRRSFATHLINADVDIFTVQKLMRHRDIDTTRRYDMRCKQTEFNALKKLPF